MANIVTNEFIQSTRRRNLTYEANQIVKDKFWIVEDNGEKIATIQSTHSGVVLVTKRKRESFSSIKMLTDRYNIKFNSTERKPKKDKDFSSNGFPCSEEPFNEIIDVRIGLPIYTKNEKSKSYYAAGYYIIKFNHGWVNAFCPKLITLERNEYKGPYKTKLEMMSKLKEVR